MVATNAEMTPTRLWILGLHHSGTTIFWRAWRKDERFLCFDEPLTGDIGFWFPENNPKRTHDEYIDTFIDSPKNFWGIYAPKEAYQELDPALSSRQEFWLSTLLKQSRNVVVDETHLHFHLSTINRLTPEGYVVHLYRRASSFVTSHLLPSSPRQVSRARATRHRLGDLHRRWRFWQNHRIPPGMERDKVVGQHPSSKFGLLLYDAGYDAELIMRSSAIVRLLAYWHLTYHKMEREGRALFGPRFRTLTYESFATDPGATMADLYDWMGLSFPIHISYADVHPPKPPFRVADRRWRRAAKMAGFCDDEIEVLL